MPVSASIIEELDKPAVLTPYTPPKPVLIRDTAAISKHELDALTQFLVSHHYDPFVLSEKLHVEFPGQPLRPLFAVICEQGRVESWNQARHVAEEVRRLGYDAIVLPDSIQLQHLPAHPIKSWPETVPQSTAQCACCNGPNASLHTIQIDSEVCKGMGYQVVCSACASQPFGFEDGKVTCCVLHRNTGRTTG